MESLCNSGGGWMRVAYLNMSDPTEECPPGFRLYNQNGIKACGRPVSAPAGYCQSVKFPSYSISYCQASVWSSYWISSDAIQPRSGGSKSINGAYVDGDGNPHKNVWTFMAALHENYISDKYFVCPCAPNGHMFHHLLVMTTSVNQVVLDNGSMFSTLIHSGMVNSVY